MTTPRLRRIAGPALLACALLSAACGAPEDDAQPAPDSTSASATQSLSESAPTQASTSAPAPAPPTTAGPSAVPDDVHGTVQPTGTPGPLEPSLLADGEVPGFQLTSKGDLEQAAAQADTAQQAAASMSVQPAQCDGPVKSLIAHAAGIYQAMSVGAAQGFSSSTGVQLTEVVVVEPDAGPYLVDVSGIAGCESSTATTGAVPTAITIEPIALGLGDSSSGAFMTQKIDVGGSSVTTVTGNVSITKNGGVVALSLTGPSDDPAALKALFEQTAQQAYAKAESWL